MIGEGSTLRTHARKHVRVGVESCAPFVALALFMLVMIALLGGTNVGTSLGLQRDAAEPVALGMHDQPRHDACEPATPDELENDDENPAWELSTLGSPRASLCEGSVRSAGSDLRASEQLVSTGLGRGPPLG